MQIVPRLWPEKHLSDLFSPVEYLGDGQRGLDGQKLIPKFSWYISTYDVRGPVKWYQSFSCAVSCHTEYARMYVHRKYPGHVCLPNRWELHEPNHPRGVIGLHHGISIYLLLASAAHMIIITLHTNYCIIIHHRCHCFCRRHNCCPRGGHTSCCHHC
jgi:hypothetical protein